MQLHTWSRKGLFEDQNITITKDEFDEWEDKFQRQTRVRFRRQAATKNDVVEGMGLGLRSSIDEDPIIGEEAYNLTTTDAKRLSRLHWEDLLRVNENSDIVIYWRKAADQSQFADYPREAAKMQPKVKESGRLKNEVKLNRADFYVTRAKVIKAQYHGEAQSGALSFPQLKTHYKRGAGFTIEFHCTAATLPFQWRQMVDFANDVYFFGAPVAGVRDYGRLFRSSWTVKYARQIYYEIGLETAGDSYSSMALSNAYKDAIIGIK